MEKIKKLSAERKLSSKLNESLNLAQGKYWNPATPLRVGKLVGRGWGAGQGGSYPPIAYVGTMGKSGNIDFLAPEKTSSFFLSRALRSLSTSWKVVKIFSSLFIMIINRNNVIWRFPFYVGIFFIRAKNIKSKTK